MKWLLRLYFLVVKTIFKTASVFCFWTCTSFSRHGVSDHLCRKDGSFVIRASLLITAAGLLEG